MAGAGVSISIEADMSGVNRAMAGMRPAAVNAKFGAAMNESLAMLQTLVQEPIPVGVTGNLRGRIFTAMRGKSANEMEGIVGSPDVYALAIERGRKPGKAPPVAALRLWCQRVLGDPGLAFVVARSIARKGMPAKGPYHMFKNAAEKGAPAVVRIFKRHFGV